ncbi:MAG: PHB depolymerase family esterase [Steroidobacteraceae bacterium]
MKRIARPRESGWIAGLFPHVPRSGAAHRQNGYALYVPRGLRRRVPLLVMLHGCSQDARAFADGTRMNELADRRRFIVLYPEQSRQANPLGCWNWFHHDLDKKGGEAARIAALIRSVCLRYPIDRSRVYVAGMSAGGAMAAILAMTHGALFAACAIASGVMYRAADSATGAVRTMHEGSRRSPARIADEAAAAPSRALGFVPALVIHGAADRVVHPRNADQIIAQFSRFAELLSTPPRALEAAAERTLSAGARTYRRRDHERDGQVMLREILIEGLAHAWSGGDSRHRFNDPAAPDASRLVWDFVSRFRRPVGARWPVTRFWRRWR